MKRNAFLLFLINSHTVVIVISSVFRKMARGKETVAWKEYNLEGEH